MFGLSNLRSAISSCFLSNIAPGHEATPDSLESKDPQDSVVLEPSISPGGPKPEAANTQVRKSCLKVQQSAIATNEIRSRFFQAVVKSVDNEVRDLSYKDKMPHAAELLAHIVSTPYQLPGHEEEQIFMHELHIPLADSEAVMRSLAYWVEITPFASDTDTAAGGIQDELQLLAEDIEEARQQPQVSSHANESHLKVIRDRYPLICEQIATLGEISRKVLHLENIKSPLEISRQIETLCERKARNKEGHLVTVGLDLTDLLHPNLSNVMQSATIDGKSLDEMFAGSLTKAITRQDPTRGNALDDIATVIKIASDIANGLRYLHYFGFIHEDLCPSHILMANPSGNAYVGQIDQTRVSAALGETLSKAAGFSDEYSSDWRLAPEVLDFDCDLPPYSAASVMYAFGCVLNAMITRKPPSSRSLSPMQISRYVPSGGRHDTFSQTDEALLAKCGAEVLSRLAALIGDATRGLWATNPNARPSANDVYCEMRELAAILREQAEQTPTSDWKLRQKDLGKKEAAQLPKLELGAFGDTWSSRELARQTKISWGKVRVGYTCSEWDAGPAVDYSNDTTRHWFDAEIDIDEHISARLNARQTRNLRRTIDAKAVSSDACITGEASKITDLIVPGTVNSRDYSMSDFAASPAKRLCDLVDAISGNQELSSSDASEFVELVGRLLRLRLNGWGENQQAQDAALNNEVERLQAELLTLRSSGEKKSIAELMRTYPTLFAAIRTVYQTAAKIERVLEVNSSGNAELTAVPYFDDHDITFDGAIPSVGLLSEVLCVAYNKQRTMLKIYRDNVSLPHIKLATELAQALDHTNLLAVKAANFAERKVVLPWAPCSLADVLDWKKPGYDGIRSALSSPEAKIRLINDIATAMAYLHFFNIPCKNLSAENILLTRKPDKSGHFYARLSDFGRSDVLLQMKNEAGKTYSAGAYKGETSSAGEAVVHSDPFVDDALAFVSLAKSIWGSWQLGLRLLKGTPTLAFLDRHEREITLSSQMNSLWNFAEAKKYILRDPGNMRVTADELLTSMLDVSHTLLGNEPPLTRTSGAQLPWLQISH